MSQIEAKPANAEKNEVCKDCKKPWYTHHKLVGVSDDGHKLSIHCHEEPVDKKDADVLKYVLQARTARQKALAELQQAKSQHVLDRQAAEAELARKHASALQVAVAEKVQSELEATRIQLNTAHEAVVADLRAQLSETSGIAEQLAAEVTEAKAKIAASEAKSVDLQLEIDRLASELKDERHHHDGLKHKSKDLVHLALTLGKRVVVLERKLGTEGMTDDVDDVYTRLLGATPPRIDLLERVVLEEAAKAAPIPTATPAPKAAAATTPPSAPKAAPAPSKPPAMVVLDDDDHAVGDDDVIERHDAAHGEDDRESCSICDAAANEQMSFTKKDGSPGLLAACDSSKHAEEFLAYLVKEAKGAPKTPADVIMLFNPIP